MYSHFCCQFFLRVNDAFHVMAFFFLFSVWYFLTLNILSLVFVQDSYIMTKLLVMLFVRIIQNIVFEGSCGKRPTPLLTLNHFVIIILWFYVSCSSSELAVFSRALHELLVHDMRRWNRAACCHHLHPTRSCCSHKPLPQNKNELLELTVCIWVCVFVGG